MIKSACFLVLCVLFALVDFPGSAQVAPLKSRMGHPLIIAHRGGAKESTENTILTFQRAIRIGADGIETDIRLTKDGIVIIYHDDKWGRVEAGTAGDRLISDMTLSEIDSHNLAPVGDDRGGRKVPTLTDALKALDNGLLNIELKAGGRFDELVDKTIDIMRNFKVIDRVVLEAPDLK